MAENLGDCSDERRSGPTPTQTLMCGPVDRPLRPWLSADL